MSKHTNTKKKNLYSTEICLPEKQSIREAIEHLFARYRANRPLLRAEARPIKEEWKIKPYFGVFPLVFSAL